MQAKLLQFFAQGEPGQPKPARGFRLISFCHHDGLGEDFAFGFGKHEGVSVLQLALLRARQQITREGGEGMASRDGFGIAGAKSLANGVGIDGESAGGEQQAARYVFQFANVARPRI